MDPFTLLALAWGWLHVKTRTRSIPSPTVASTYSILYAASGAAHRVDPLLLAAIAHVESGENPKATRTNRNGTVDRGLMQINDAVRNDYGLTADALFNPATSIDTAARLLARNAAALASAGLRGFDALVSSYNRGVTGTKQHGIASSYVAKVRAEYTRRGGVWA